MTVEIPEGLGNVFTHMGWQLITYKDSPQYKLREKYGTNFDDDGFGYIDDEDDDDERYLAVAVTSTFGDVGDKLRIYLEGEGSFLAVIGDIKSQNDKGCNKYGHQNGHCVVEFIVDKDSREWKGYGGEKVPSSAWPLLKNNRVTKISNIGAFDFDE